MMSGATDNGWLPPAAFIVAAFSALRLARFNVDGEQEESFTGLPTPANALFFASLGWLCHMGAMKPDIYALTGAAAVMSWLLISPVRMFSLKFRNLSLCENALRLVFLFLSAVALLFFGAGALPAIIGGYVAVSTVIWAFSRK
jgi:CDP-diacylglycerol--serine O-phosphatidyltransferase